MARWRGVGPLGLGLLLGASACSRPSPSVTAPPPADRSTSDSATPVQPATAQLDELRALGYLAVAEGEADPSVVGAVTHDAEAVQPGFNLYATRVRCIATLIDNQGAEQRRWQVPDCRGWDHVELLPNGDLLASIIGRSRGGLRAGPRTAQEEHFLVRLDWLGVVRWRVPLWAHHDAIARPDGSLAAITSAERLFPTIHARAPILDDGVTLLSAEGRVERTVSLTDLLLRNPIGFRLQRVRPQGQGRQPTIDLLHTNAITWMTDPKLAKRDPLYAASNALLCLRHQDALVVVDLDAPRLVWAWGQGILSGPHDATVLADGHFLVFDNGLSRGRSRVLELDPLRREIVWEYPSPNGPHFFTRSHGAAQRLPNGNTLIVSSDEAHAFEVTRDGRTVWEFYGPLAAGLAEGQHRRATLNRMRRYPASTIKAFR